MGKVNIIESGSDITITLDGNTGDISVGGNGQDGDLIVKNPSGTERIRLDGQMGSITARSAAMVMVFNVNGDTGEVILQGVNPPGQGAPRIYFSPATANIGVGGHGQGGDLILSDKNGFPRIGLNADNEDLLIRDAPKTGAWLGQVRIHLSGASANIELKNDQGVNTIRFDGAKADLFAGGGGQDGTVIVRNGAGADKIHLDGKTGALIVRNSNGDEVVRLDSFLSPSPDPDEFASYEGGRIVLKSFNGLDTIVLDGTLGDIALKNADCAEDFDVSQSAKVEPGTVVVIDEESRLQPSLKPYDKKVAGVISGAGNCKPGLVLDKKESQPHRLPVALVGKVYCKVDAQYSAIEVGDLLTTSPTLGHAMKADDPLKAFGAVIGKALRPLKAGQGLIPILIALQ